jgi:hypothetical protein
VQYDGGTETNLQHRYRDLASDASSGGGGGFGAFRGFKGLGGSSGGGGSAFGGGSASEREARRLRIKGGPDSLWKLFDGPPSAQDVSQGRLGDWSVSYLPLCIR